MIITRPIAIKTLTLDHTTLTVKDPEKEAF